MLVLHRRPGESVLLLDRESSKVIAEVVVLASHDGRISLGFDAEQTVEILRTELLAKEKSC